MEREREKERDPLRTIETKRNTKNCSSRRPDSALHIKRKFYLNQLLARHGLDESEHVYKLFGEWKVVKHFP